MIKNRICDIAAISWFQALFLIIIFTNIYFFAKGHSTSPFNTINFSIFYGWLIIIAFVLEVVVLASQFLIDLFFSYQINFEVIWMVYYFFMPAIFFCLSIYLLLKIWRGCVDKAFLKKILMLHVIGVSFGVIISLLTQWNQLYQEADYTLLAIITLIDIIPAALLWGLFFQILNKQEASNLQKYHID